MSLDLPQIVQQVLFLLFADLTALVAAVIGPTYDNLLVPELARHALFPGVLGAPPGPQDYLGQAAAFSDYLVTGVVDPVVGLLALGVAILYFAKVATARWAATFDALLPRLLLSVVVANFTVPIAAGILDLAGATYPVVAGWDGGRWQHWENLGGVGEIQFSWDNGALAFVLSMAQFLLVVSLVLAIGLRDALLAVLLVVLPVVTLLWPFRPAAAIPRRAWQLFVELAFLPCVVVVPLELAVAAPSSVLLVGYLGAALGAPFLLSAAGSHLVALGFPGGSGVVQSGVARGTASAPSSALAPVRSALGQGTVRGGASRGLGSAIRGVSAAPAPLAVPAAISELLGQGARAVARHVGRSVSRDARPPRLPAFHPREDGGDGRA